MTLEKLIEQVRESHLFDTKDPYLWSTSELINYINNTITELATETLCIKDADSSVARIRVRVATFEGSANVSFTASNKRITCTAGGFTAAGFTHTGVKLRVDGTESNDGLYTIASVSDTVLTVSETLVDEADTSAALEIPPYYPLSNRIVYLDEEDVRFSADDDTDGTINVLKKYTLNDLNSRNSSWRSMSGAYPELFVLDFKSGYILLYPPSESDGIIYLNTARILISDLTESDLKTEIPDIPARWHWMLIPGICAQAYRKEDSQVLDPERANTYKVEWAINTNSIKKEINFREQSFKPEFPSGLF